MSTSRTDIPEPDSSSEPEDPEYFEKCLSDYEDLYESYCEARLYEHLNGASPIDSYTLSGVPRRPIADTKEGQDNG